MTITLHWWVIPAFLLALSIYFFSRKKDTLDRFFSFWVAVALVMTAGGVIVGRLL